MTRFFSYLIVGAALASLGSMSRTAYVIASILVGIRLSLPELQNAKWLNHHAPAESDSIINAWFHAAYGIWLGAAAVVGLYALRQVVRMWMLGGRLTMYFWLDCYDVIVIAMAIASFLPLTGSVLAWLSWVKVWIDPQLSKSRLEDTWPPLPSARNAYPWLLIPQVLMVLCAAFWSVADRSTASRQEIEYRWLLALIPLVTLFLITWARTPEQRWKMGKA